MTGRRPGPALLVLALVLAALPLPAQTSDCADWVARTVSVQGRVETRRAGQVAWLPVKLEATHCPGDAVRLGPLSRAALALRDGAILRLDQNTTITFTPPAERAATWIELLTGAVHFWSRTPRGLRITTPFVNGSVEGTEFLIEVDAVEARLSVWEGRVLAENAQGSLTLTAGQSAAARAGQAPALRPIVVQPGDAVAWTLYYPPVLDLRPDDFPDRPGDTWPAEIRRSITAARAGELEVAFAGLAGVPDTVQDPRVLAYRASLLLAVGRLDEARPLIERALALDPGHAPALALQSVVTVAQNARAEAVRLANEAVARDSSSVAAHVAQSYARQAAFDLSGARESLQVAARLDPGSALVRARLAELWLAEGHVDRALQEAEEAVRLGPALGRTHTVLGFVRLARLEVGRAAEAFGRAIALDSGAPLPRLGLGLARIRRGDLDGGRQELEIAVGLDPGDALLRSYLGKAYYEERRTEHAARELERAEALDPADPTAWLYEAILKQSVNRPVEALRALQRSIDLNDNRAVYRSLLRIDEDRATRDTSLARIYDNLGFNQRALVEAWRSLSIDPTNYSAHTFLADAYAVLPRNEVARSSQVLQSQMLQPLGTRPIQPQFGLSRSFILAGTAPADPSFNEFGALFERNGLSLSASGVVGGNATFGDQIVLNGLWNQFSVTLGQFYYETDGFRANNDLRQEAYSLFGQLGVTPSTTLSLEARLSDRDAGDLQLRFDPSNFSSTLRQGERIESVRLGLRHDFAPWSTLLATAGYHWATFDTDISPEFSLHTDEDGPIAELQHLHRGDWVDVVAGGGYLPVFRKDRSTGLPTVKTTVEQANVYAYAYLRYPKGFTWTLGASGDFLDSGDLRREEFDPKVGLVWAPLPGTTVRAAAIRTLARALISSQTLEPTQVAGFTQVFDDVEGTSAWRYGVGVDQVLPADFYVGAEVSRRDLDVPLLVEGPPRAVVDQSEREDLGRAYIYWAPHPWFALAVEYFYERLKLDPNAGNVVQTAESRTHRVPMTVSFFHPSGVTAWLRGTYVDQRGTFADAAGSLFQGQDDFFVVDAALQYRLPRRWGFLSLEAKNLFDQRFRFQDTDPANPAIAPGRLVLFKFTLAY